jgi:hypothetical protein
MSFVVVRNSYPDIVKDGLVLNVDAGASISYPGSGTTWTDISGNGNTGTLVNGPTYSTANGGVIVFDGTNDYVNFSTYSQPAYTTTTSFSWNVWVYPVSNSDFVIMGNRGGAELIFTKLTTNNFEYYPTNLGGVMPLNVWQNICVIKDQTNLYYYRNSSLIASTTSSSTKTSRPFYVGGDPGASEYTNSRIAQVSIYNRALTAAEILQNYNALLPRFYSIVTSGLVLNLDAGNPNSYSPPRSDQYASSLVLAVPMNGANNGTTFTDESATIRGSGSAKAITRFGDTKTLTAVSKFYGSSGFFDGTGDYLSIANNADFDLSGDFTIECWAYSVTALSAYTAQFAHIFGKGNGVLTGTYSLCFYQSRVLFVYSSVLSQGASTLTNNTWYHFAVTRVSGVLKIFVNGQLDYSASVSNNLTSSSSFNIGDRQASDPSGQYPLNGYIQDLRVYKGVAKYTTNFKPPSISSGVTISSASGGVPILNTTDDYGTVNGSSGTTWTDISGNGNTGTLINGPTYNGANYGSIVFDGVDDYAQKTSSTMNLSSGVSMEMVFKSTDMNSRQQGFMSYSVNASTYINFYTSGNGRLRWETIPSYGSSGGSFLTPTALSNNTWYHVVGTYVNGSSILYVNGSSVASSTYSAVNYSSSYTANIDIAAYLVFGQFSGNIAVASIYNKALSAAEISQNFNALKWRYGI